MPKTSNQGGGSRESLRCLSSDVGLPVRFLEELCEQRKIPALFPAAAVDALRELSGACEALGIIAAAKEAAGK